MKLSTIRRAGLAALALWALLAAAPARAGFYTDIWFNPGEAGWGVNVVQSDSFMFLTFFIYGDGGNPTWDTAQLVRDASGAYSGSLFATRGTNYALPWNSANNAVQQVGTALFTPSGANAYEATLTYTVDGVATVTKAIQRQTLTAIGLGGQYVGGLSGAQTGCADPANNGTFGDVYALQVTQEQSGAATFTFSLEGFACTLSGNLVLHGSQYTMTGATYQCVQNNATVFSGTANMSQIKSTAQGIEGRWVAPTGDSCVESARFSAVLF
jgi:hypothetical protein